MTLALIDSDSLMFKIIHRAKSKYDMRQLWKQKIKDITDVTFSDQAVVGIKGAHRNFRYDILPDYKGTRPKLDQKVKDDLNYLHSFAVEQGAITAPEGLETDDQIQMWVQEAWHDETDVVICHIDKDLDTIPGSHYNYNKDEHYTVSLDEALYNFYHQLLTGDKSDNIPGLKGIGPVKASRMLDGLKPDEYITKVSWAWGIRDKDMEASARCLFMGQPEDFTWDLRELYAKEESKTGMETVHEPLEESSTVLHRDDIENGDTPDELLRDEQDSDGMDGSGESNTTAVREEV